MSNTRTAKPGGDLRQERWASSPEYERGFLANLVAQRCRQLESPKDREWVWFLQYLSWCDGFRQLAEDLHREKSDLAASLQDVCLNPSFDLGSAGTSELEDLRVCYSRWKASHRERLVITEIGQQIRDGLDYACKRTLILASGLARRGKTFAARAWCEENAGRARYVEVPPFNDAEGFFRSIARAIGVSSSITTKAKEMRARIEPVLLSGDVLLCLDEATRLWPQTNLRFSVPERVNWVMHMANRGAQFFLLSTPQFLEVQKQMEDRSRWNAAQWNGRLEYLDLVEHVSPADFLKIARASLAGAPEDVLKAAAIYARGSQHYLAAIDSIRTRALHLAERAGRPIRPEDFRAALGEKLRADSAFGSAAEAARKQVTSNRRRRTRCDTDFAENSAPSRINTDRLQLHEL